MTSSSEPIGPDELEALFGRFFSGPGEPSIALAVSGGGDSTALMVLFAEWLARRGWATSGASVLTVDHGLRPQSAAEAQCVAAQAALYGFRHATLRWEGPKPATGVQAAARTARYRLMRTYAAGHGIKAILTAHTADDQAETLLMRLARGSGLDGLSAMAEVTRLDMAPAVDDPGLMLVRPLLDVPKARLLASLRQRGIAWIEDPSNDLATFERPRLRAARGQLEAIGLTGDRLALSARRLRRARLAIETWVDSFFGPAAGNVRVDPCGFFVVAGERLREAPLEIVVRVLARAIAAAGGSEEPVPLARLEEIAQEVAAGTSGRWTLGRAKITASVNSLLVEREPGREALPRLTLAAGETGVWDGRFLVHAGAGLGAPVDVCALGAEELGRLRAAGAALPRASAGVLHALPAFWRGRDLLAVPSAGFWGDPSVHGRLSATFPALGRYNLRLDGE